jgi:hypothetical protein
MPQTVALLKSILSSVADRKRYEIMSTKAAVLASSKSVGGATKKAQILGPPTG